MELTGDIAPDMRAVAGADVIITTPEKWDGVSRSWQSRGYVRQVALLIIDEIHLLGKLTVIFYASYNENLHYARGITPRLVTSGGAHLCLGNAAPKKHCWGGECRNLQ